MKLLDDSFLTLKLYIALALAGAVYAVIARFIRYRISDSWTLVQGTVERAGVTAAQEGENTVYVAEVAYSYSVEGDFYGGHYRKRYASEAAADKLVELFPARAAVTIRYKPRHPETSMLREDDNTSRLSAASSRS